MIDNLGGVRDLINRHRLPPALTHLIEVIEESGMKVDAPPAAGVAEVKDLLVLVDGPSLIAGILACILASQAEELAMLNADEATDETPEDATPSAGDGSDTSDAEGEGEEGESSPELPPYRPDDNDAEIATDGEHMLIGKGGGHFSIVRWTNGEDPRIVETVRGKGTAERRFKEIVAQG